MLHPAPDFAAHLVAALTDVHKQHTDGIRAQQVLPSTSMREAKCTWGVLVVAANPSLLRSQPVCADGLANSVARHPQRVIIRGMFLASSSSPHGGLIEDSGWQRLISACLVHCTFATSSRFA